MGLGPVIRVEEFEYCLLVSVCVVKRIKLCFWATSLVLFWIILLKPGEQEDDKITRVENLPISHCNSLPLYAILMDYL